MGSASAHHAAMQLRYNGAVRYVRLPRVQTAAVRVRVLRCAANSAAAAHKRYRTVLRVRRITA